MNEPGKCSVESCSSPAVTCFGKEQFCLEHFLSYCYDQLSTLDLRVDSEELKQEHAAAVKAFVEECWRRALEVSLRYPGMENLQRGKILDILLWAGELLPRRAPALRAAASCRL